MVQWVRQLRRKRFLFLMLLPILIATLLSKGTMSGERVADVAAQDLDASSWRHLSTVTGDIAPPSLSTEQTASLVLDIDNDGDNDLVVGARKAPGPALVWYRRHASGWDRYVLDSAVLPVEAGGAFYDIDQDGDLDIVMGGDYQSNQVWWWENPYPEYAPDVSWTRRLIKDGGDKVQHDQMFGDFDNNGRVELVFWNQVSWSAGQKYLMAAEIPADPANSGTWPLTTIKSWNSTDTPEGLAQIDMDGDGLLDIVGGGSWFKYDGSAFTEQVIAAEQKAARVAAGQLIPGGRPEVVFSSGDGVGPLLMYAWDGSSWQGTNVLGIDVDHGHSLQIEDVNQDGRLDIFVAEMRLNGDNEDAKMWLMLGDGTGNFTTDEISVGIGNHESRLADLDGDGDLDIFGKPYNWATPRLDIWLNEASCSVSLDTWQRHLVDDDRPARAIFVLPGDLDGDGLADIASGDSWYRNPGTPSGTWDRQAIGAPLYNVAALHDFDGDGRVDILGTQGIGSASNANFAWARNMGDGAFTIYTNIDAAQGDFLQGVAVERFTPGGPLEIMLSWHDETKPLQALEVPQDPLAERWTWRVVQEFSAGEQLSAGDIDRDGDQDLLLGTHWLQNDTPRDPGWADTARRFRLPFSVQANGYARQDMPAELEVDFTALLAEVGASGSLNIDALRVVEVDAGGTVLNNNVPFQFDPASDYDAASNARGRMIVLLEGATAENGQRDFQLYFDVTGGPPVSPMPVTQRVNLTDEVLDVEQASYRLQTDSGTYFYHKDGGGFSSLLDREGNDWISHSDEDGAAGDFRGIPNLVHPDDGGYFHPGRDTSTSEILQQGPLKATFVSSSVDGAWETVWEIYPAFARLTVMKAAGAYWFLYEGTPGGVLEPGSDFVVRSNGATTLAAESWSGDISGGEWAYFSDPNAGRSLYFINQVDDAIVDSYYAMNGLMTVFGFGRDGNNRFLTATPQQFMMGFAEDTDWPRSLRWSMGLTSRWG